MEGGYVDGFVLTVPKKNFGMYKKMAAEAGKVWRKHGALGYFECRGEDLRTKSMGGVRPRSFVEMSKAKKGEDVWYSFIIYKSRAHRDAVNKSVMAYFAKKYDMKKHMEMPFDTKKMAYGGFKAVVCY